MQTAASRPQKTNTIRPRRLWPVLMMLVLWAAAVPTAWGHGVLERSDPPATAVLEAPPDQIRLWFSEPVDPGFSTVWVLDPAGTRRAGTVSVSPDRRQISMVPADLRQGVYTVRWQILSAADGHITSGSFVFGVGQVIPAGMTAEASAASAPSVLRVLVRWIGLLGALLLAGIVWFHLTVLRAGLGRLPVGDAVRIGAAVTRRLQSVGALAAAIVLVAVLAEFTAQAGALFGGAQEQPGANGRLLALLGSTKAGWSLLVRSPLAALVLVLLLRRRSTPAGWTAGSAVGGLLAGYPLAAHAAGRGAAACAADWAHLAAVALWIGGLTGLLLALRAASVDDRPPLARALVPRFSLVAATGLAVAVLTGALGARLHVPDLQALVTTAYGRALLAKVVLVAPLVALGALNRFLVRPALLRPDGASSPATRRLVPVALGEVAIAAVIVLIVAVLTLTPPPPRMPSAAAQKPLRLGGTAGDTQVHLTVAPATPGRNSFDVTVTDTTGRPVAGEARVLIRTLKLDEHLAPATFTLDHVGQGRYRIEGAALSLPGFWQVEVVLRRTGRFDEATTFPLRLGPGPRAESSDDEARRLFALVHTAVASVRTWRETQQLTDGVGSAYLTWLQAERPDRQHFRTSSGVEVIAIGTDRYQRTGSDPWKRYTFSAPVPVEGPLYYMRGARAIRLGRTGSCDAESCRVVLWTSPDGGAEFAAWVGLRSHRVHRLLMLEPTHYMTVWFSDFNAPVRVQAPGP